MTREIDMQMTLGFAEFYSTDIKAGSGETIKQRFESFHELNPHVYRALVSIARKLKSQGHRRVSMKALFEFLRMSWMLQTRGDRDFKLNNNLTALYSRLVIDQEPDLAGCFEVRIRRTA